MPVKEALFELLQTFVFLIGHMPRRIDAAARRRDSIMIGLAVRCPREEARRILISSSGTHIGRSLVAAA